MMLNAGSAQNPEETTKWYDEAIKSVAFIYRPEIASTIRDNRIDTVTIIKPHATGFFVWNYGKGAPLLVTNKHVLVGQKQLYVLYRTRESEIAKLSTINLFNKNNNPIWKAHPNDQVDIAAIECKNLKDGTIICYPYSFFGMEGDYRLLDEVLYFGYPLGLHEKQTYKPVAKQGMIGRLNEDESGYFIDATVAPGNSGSPVFLKPSLSREPGVIAPYGPKLIGIISWGYPQAGLTWVFHAAHIKTVVDLWK